MKRLTAAIGLLTAALLLAACGQNNQPPPSQQGTIKSKMKPIVSLVITDKQSNPFAHISLDQVKSSKQPIEVINQSKRPLVARINIITGPEIKTGIIPRQLIGPGQTALFISKFRIEGQSRNQMVSIEVLS